MKQKAQGFSLVVSTIFFERHSSSAFHTESRRTWQTVQLQFTNSNATAHLNFQLLVSLPVVVIIVWFPAAFYWLVCRHWSEGCHIVTFLMLSAFYCWLPLVTRPSLYQLCDVSSYHNFCGKPKDSVSGVSFFSETAKYSTMCSILNKGSLCILRVVMKITWIWILKSFRDIKLKPALDVQNHLWHWPGLK